MDVVLGKKKEWMDKPNVYLTKDLYLEYANYSNNSMTWQKFNF